MLTLVSAFYRMITNDLTYDQYICHETDQYGNPTKDGKLLKGMVVSASSVFNDDPMCQPHMVFHNNPQSWMPDYKELKDGRACHINVDLKTPYNRPNGSRGYMYNTPIVPVRMMLEIDNRNSLIKDIQLWGALLPSIDEEEATTVHGTALYDINGDVLVDKNGYMLYDNVDRYKGEWQKIISLPSHDIMGKYINRTFALDHACTSDMLFNRFKLVFIIDPNKLPKHGTIYLKKFDMFREATSDDAVQKHKHYWEDIIDPPNLDFNFKQYVLPPVNTSVELPIKDDIEVGTICMVVSECKVYMWNGEYWQAPAIGQQPEEEDKEEEVLYRHIVLTPDKYVFDIGSGISRHKLRVEDEDGIKWTDNRDYWVEEGLIKFNEDLIPPYKFYPDGLIVNVYRTRPIVQESANEIYLVSYDEIHETDPATGKDINMHNVFRLVTDENGDLYLNYEGKDIDPKFNDTPLFDGLAILGDEDIVYTVFANADGYLLSVEGDYDDETDAPGTDKNYDYILISNYMGEEAFYLDMTTQGDVFTAPMSTVSISSIGEYGAFNAKEAYENMKMRPMGSRVLNVRAISC